MPVKAVLALLTVLLALHALFADAAAGKVPRRHRGVCLEHAFHPDRSSGYGTPASARALDELRRRGVEWVSVTPFAGMRSPEATELRRYGAESDGALREVARQARARGLKVMMKPHLWLRPPRWVGDVEQRTEAGWAAFFAAYEAYVLPLAKLSAEEGVEAFSVGNEMEKTTHRVREWRALVARVRALYPGLLTYGATTTEAERIPFWDALDVVGVSAYYPLSPERHPDRATLVAAWREVTPRLAALSARTRRKVLFTEAGWRSADHGTWRHWEIPSEATVNLALQETAYEALFEAVWDEPWFAGVYFWKWPSSGVLGRGLEDDYPPVDKPAAEVMARRFREPAAR